jgi:CRISPR/Cas system-associated exonuclease Cas4 (RecB family)
LLDQIKTKNAKSIRFEIPLGDNPWNLVGSIDSILELPDKKFIVIDFKRSSSAAGTKAETLELKKIQIWIYILVLISQGYEVDSFGYLIISDLSEDKLMFETKLAQKMIESSLGDVKILIEKSIHEILTRVQFLPEPRDQKVCYFCPVNLFCLKGQVDE